MVPSAILDRLQSAIRITYTIFVLIDSVDLTAKSLSDIHSISFDIESAASTPAMQRVNAFFCAVMDE